MIFSFSDVVEVFPSDVQSEHGPQALLKALRGAVSSLFGFRSMYLGCPGRNLNPGAARWWLGSFDSLNFMFIK